MATTDPGTDIENLIALAILQVEKKYGLAGLDHVSKIIDSRRKTMIYEADSERKWEPK